MSVWHKAWSYDQHPLQVDKEGNPKPNSKNPPAKAVLVALAEFPQPGVRECWPAQETLADMTDFEERTVRKHLAALEVQGYISRRERRAKDGTRLTDVVTFLAPIELLGPSRNPAERDAGGPPEPGATATGTTFRGNVKEEPFTEEPLVVVGPDDISTRCLQLLLQVKGFPRDQAENALKLAKYREDFPDVDPVEVCKDFQAFISEKPFKAGDKPRLRLRNFFKQAQKFQSQNGGRKSGSGIAVIKAKEEDYSLEEYTFND